MEALREGTGYRKSVRDQLFSEKITVVPFPQEWNRLQQAGVTGDVINRAVSSFIIEVGGSQLAIRGGVEEYGSRSQ